MLFLLFHSSFHSADQTDRQTKTTAKILSVPIYTSDKGPFQPETQTANIPAINQLCVFVAFLFCPAAAVAAAAKLPKGTNDQKTSENERDHRQQQQQQYSQLVRPSQSLAKTRSKKFVPNRRHEVAVCVLVGVGGPLGWRGAASTGWNPVLHRRICLHCWMRGFGTCLLYTSPSPRDRQKSRMPSSA